MVLATLLNILLILVAIPGLTANPAPSSFHKYFTFPPLLRYTRSTILNLETFQCEYTLF